MAIRDRKHVINSPDMFPLWVWMFHQIDIGIMDGGCIALLTRRRFTPLRVFAWTAKWFERKGAGEMHAWRYSVADAERMKRFVRSGMSDEAFNALKREVPP